MANTPIYNMTDTWNAGGTTFNAIKMSVTDTASASGSLLLDLLVGGSSKFSVDKAGNVAAAGTLAVTGASTLAALGATNITASGTLGVTGLATFTASAAFNAGIGTCGPTIGQIAFGFGAKARGGQDTAIGQNTCGGNTADVNYSGLANTCIGATAGQALTTATQSCFVGSTAGTAVTTGGSNVLVGHGAGLQLTTGARNHCLGVFAGRGQNFGNDNILIGHNCARDITGNSNIVLKSSTATTGYLDDLAGTNQINIGDRYFHNRIQLKNAASGAGDCILLREAADVLAMQRGTNAQTLRLYNTWTDDSNYERGYLDWSSNVMRLGTQKLGTGTARALELQTDGTTAVTLTTGQKAEFAATIKTAAPSGGTAAEWKLGTVASVTPTSPDRTIEVEIGGTTYYLSAKTTND